MPQSPTDRKTPEGRFGTPGDSNCCLDDSTPINLPIPGSTVELLAVAKDLLQTISPGYDTESPPKLFLAFDEAHTITVPITSHGVHWSIFSSLRRALRRIRFLPIWSIFLSTAGKLYQFTPAPFLDDSNRIVEGRLTILMPFSALGFDLLAEVLSDGIATLDHVASLEYKLSLGRPLYVLPSIMHDRYTHAASWKTRYEAGSPEVQRTMVVFAMEKLLCRTYQPHECLNASKEELFAILSHRLALDFNTPACSGSRRRSAEKNQMVQVEKHMRVCLGVREGFESLVTVAASEPILVEAAATIMQHKEFSSCLALREILGWPGMSKGDRGELIVAHITIDTIDHLSFNNRKLKSFIVKATSYFEALFAQELYQDHIKKAMPSKLRDDNEDKSFAETFKDSLIYLTHFIKVYDYSVLTDGFIMACAARGVGIICADNHAGVDLVIPMLYKDHILKRANMTVILKQSKNDATYSTTPKQYLFNVMNPFTLKVFNKSERTPRPIIRMVYALAARRSIVHVMQRGMRTSPRKAKGIINHNYTSFDIWCGHTSSSTFGAIRPENDATYQELLKQSKEVVEMFDPEQDSMKELTMSMYPCATSKPAHWNSFFDLKSIVTDAPSHDEGLSRESDSDDESEEVSSPFQSSSRVYEHAERHSSDATSKMTKPQNAKPGNSKSKPKSSRTNEPESSKVAAKAKDKGKGKEGAARARTLGRRGREE